MTKHQLNNYVPIFHLKFLAQCSLVFHKLFAFSHLQIQLLQPDQNLQVLLTYCHSEIGYLALDPYELHDADVNTLMRLLAITYNTKLLVHAIVFFALLAHL